MTRYLRALPTLISAALVLLVVPSSATALDRLCDTQYEDCRAPLLELIRNEQLGIDVAFWFMNDTRYVSALSDAHQRGVPVRVLIDQRANVSHPYNAPMLDGLRNAGLPMRDKNGGASILHFKMMLFHGQDVVQFSKANYSWESLTPIQPNVDYVDEVIYFTDDDNVTNSFRRRFDDLWTDPTLSQNFANISGTPVRNYAMFPIHSSMNFVPLEDFAARANSRYDAETQRIDTIIFRATDHRQADGMIRAVARGIPVRLITEPTEYRNPVRLWHAKHVDRMYMGGVQIKHSRHQGFLHQMSVVMHGLGEVIFGSSNWSSSSALWQEEHNYFYDPTLGKPGFFQWFADQFNRKWNDTTNYVPFQPLPPDVPSYSLPSNGVAGVSSSATLTWDGGNWAHLYDIYFGTSPNPPLIESNREDIGSPLDGQIERYTVDNLLPGTTYYWRIVGKTWAQLSASGPTWSFTTAGTGGGGGGATPFGGVAAAIPGTFQAENFDEGGQGVAYYDTTPEDRGLTNPTYRLTSVDIKSFGGGYYVGWTRASEWMKYTVNVAATGTYTLETRIANIGTGATFRVEVDGVDRTGPIAVPDTGGWETWQTIATPGISLTAGTRVIRVVFANIASTGGIGNYDWFRLTANTSPPPPPPPSNTPYGGAAAAVPGTVQAENFDEGGQNVAYSDTTAEDRGRTDPPYRLTSVDIARFSSGSNEHYVGWTRASEWMKYTVNVATTGTYTLETRVANMGTGATFRVEVDGVDRTGPIAVPDTGGWETWQTIATTGIPLTAGTRVIRFVFVAVASTGGIGNYDWFRFTASTSNSAYGGTPAALPGVVQTENFDEGGQHVAYYDTTADDKGGTSYRLTPTSVDIARLSGGSDDYYVAWTRAGEWLDYTVNVTATRDYTMNVRVANVGSGATFRVAVDNVPLTGAIPVPDTGGWETWQTVSMSGIPLTEGQRVLRLEMLSRNVDNSGVGNYDNLWFQ